MVFPTNEQQDHYQWCVRCSIRTEVQDVKFLIDGSLRWCDHYQGSQVRQMMIVFCPGISHVRFLHSYIDLFTPPLPSKYDTYILTGWIEHVHCIQTTTDMLVSDSVFHIINVECGRKYNARSTRVGICLGKTATNQSKGTLV